MLLSYTDELCWLIKIGCVVTDIHSIYLFIVYTNLYVIKFICPYFLQDLEEAKGYTLLVACDHFILKKDKIR